MQLSNRITTTKRAVAYVGYADQYLLYQKLKWRVLKAQDDKNTHLISCLKKDIIFPDKILIRLTDEWIKKMWYVYTVEYYSAIQKDETMSTAETWIDLETSMLNENKSGRERKISCDIPYMCDLKYDTHELIYETEIDTYTQRTDLWSSRGREVGEGRTGNLELADAHYYIWNG